MTHVPAHGLRGDALKEARANNDLRAQMDLVRAAILAKLNAGKPAQEVSSWIDVEAFYTDRMIVCTDDGKCWSYPYTIKGTDVTLSDPMQVVETYVPLKEAGLRLLTEADAAAAGTTPGVVWEATLIRAGMSTGSKVFYSDKALREAVALFEGARIFVKGDKQHIAGEGKDVRQMVGWVSGVAFVEGATPDTGKLTAKVQLPGLPDATRNLLREASLAGQTNLVGLSIDAEGKTRREQRGGAAVPVVQSFTKVNSVDLIVEPGAGGSLVRMVEAAATHEDKDPDVSIKQRMLEAIREKDAAKAAQINLDTISDEALEAAYREALAPAPAASAASAGTGGTAGQQPAVATLEDLRMLEARTVARSKIAGCNLPQPAKDKLTADFAQRASFKEADVDAAIQAERDYLARFTESGHVRMGEQGSALVEDLGVKLGDMLDAFFDPQHKHHRDVRSFKECYREITGDKRVTGRLEDCDPSRLREALGQAGAQSLRESATSSTFANVLGNSITRRMLADYSTSDQYSVWQYLAGTPVPLEDFRTQERTRMGGYGDLPIVAESGAYQSQTTPSDEKATYAVAKRGGLEDITLEMIKNDDVGMIRQIPLKLSRAAKRTLSKFVLDFLRTNPTIYDSTAWFTAGHGNLGTAALDATQVSAARLAVLKMTEAGSNDRLGIPPKYLWVPYDLQQTAVDLFARNTNLDKTFVQNLNLQVVPVWYWTDTNDWCVTLDPSDMAFFELGFLDGQEEPSLFVQDMPNVGSMFSNDKLTYKIRHIYGAAVTNFRGGFKAIVP